MKCRHFQHEFQGKDRRKDNIQVIQRLRIVFRLFIVLEALVDRCYFPGGKEC